ncbi:MAG: hypothetical protein HQL50_10555 [Magnetococcales bacterium]|nr:hypothetical protein [Magnetococcales bacterium]
MNDSAPQETGEPEALSPDMETFIPESDLGDHRRPIPGRTPTAATDGSPCWHPEDLEPLLSRKGWKKRHRRLQPKTDPAAVIEREGQRIRLFGESQTISEEAYLVHHKATMQRRIQEWEKRWAGYSQRVQGFLTQFGETDDPVVVETELHILNDEWTRLSDQHESLSSAARKLDLAIIQLDDDALYDAVDHSLQLRFHHLLKECPEENHPLAHEVHQRLRDREGDEIGHMWSYWEFFGRFFKTLEISIFERDVAEATRIHDFHTLFAARKQFRHFTLYLGPTNSGKTYQALQKLKAAKTGVYLAPLRLLALEVAETLNEAGVPCDMITGEERIITEGAQHIASTVEMLHLNTPYDVAVIDEAQMLGDADRGWAWTQAILGVQAEEVCVIAAPEALPVLEKLLKLTGDPYEVVNLERLSPLKMMQKPVRDFSEIEPGTAVIAFSRAAVLGLKRDIERETGKPVAVLYGALPPEVRRRQAHRFASGEAPYLAASDAIGMGLNLPIRTILFSQDSKFYNRTNHPLTPMEVRQIAGRAGRFGKNEIGFVGTFRIPLKNIRTAFNRAPATITRAHLAPNLGHLLAIADIQERRRPQLARLLTLFARAVKPDPTIYKVSDLEDQTVLARITDRQKRLELSTRFSLSAAPVPLRAGAAVSAYEMMVTALARDKRLSLEKVLALSAQGYGRFRLEQLETDVRIINLYGWLHYRFPETFPDIEETAALRRTMNQEIDSLLTKSKDRKEEGFVCGKCGVPLNKKYPERTLCPGCFAKRSRGGQRRRGPGFRRNSGRGRGGRGGRGGRSR